MSAIGLISVTSVRAALRGSHMATDAACRITDRRCETDSAVQSQTRAASWVPAVSDVESSGQSEHDKSRESLGRVTLLLLPWHVTSMVYASSQSRETMLRRRSRAVTSVGSAA
jgi:hypothetical protein